jgi:hypothetical protein
MRRRPTARPCHRPASRNARGCPACHAGVRRSAARPAGGGHPPPRGGQRLSRPPWRDGVRRRSRRCCASRRPRSGWRG